MLTVAFNSPLDNLICRRIGFWTFLNDSKVIRFLHPFINEELKTNKNIRISIKLIQNHQKYLLFLNIQVKVRLHIQYKFNSEIRFLKSFLKVIKSSKTFLKVMTLQLNFLRQTKYWDVDFIYKELCANLPQQSTYFWRWLSNVKTLPAKKRLEAAKWTCISLFQGHTKIRNSSFHIHQSLALRKYGTAPFKFLAGITHRHLIRK